MSVQSVQADEAKRTERARNEYMTYLVLENNTHAVIGDSGTAHIIDVDGVAATDCSCPDRENRGLRCKHMAAYEEWLFDEIRMSSGTEIEL